MGLSDATAFHLSLATAAIFLDLKNGIPLAKIKENRESIKYYSEVLQRLHRRMSDASERVSPSVVGTVLGFICHDVSPHPVLSGF